MIKQSQHQASDTKAWQRFIGLAATKQEASAASAWVPFSHAAWQQPHLDRTMLAGLLLLGTAVVAVLMPSTPAAAGEGPLSDTVRSLQLRAAVLFWSAGARAAALHAAKQPEACMVRDLVQKT